MRALTQEEEIELKKWCVTRANCYAHYADSLSDRLEAAGKIFAFLVKKETPEPEPLKGADKL